VKVLVTGAGGFIGGHLVKRLLDDGHQVRGVDIKPKRDWWQVHDSDNMLLDLRDRYSCDVAVGNGENDPELKPVDWVFNLAADMGGIGFIESHKADCMLSVLINTQLLQAAKEAGVDRYLFTSSACVYPQFLQGEKASRLLNLALEEHDAYPADPEDGYGWEKLFSERMCRHFREDYGLETRVARLHNVYGPHGTWEGGREKAPAALCRKVAKIEQELAGQLFIWGDGEQTRSFMYVDDCVEGLLRIMDGDYPDPLNLGSSELVTINELADTVLAVSEVGPHLRCYDPDRPQGVRGRNSDNTLIMEKLGWEPTTSLAEGLRPTYEWIAEQVNAPRERGDWPMPAWGRAGT